MTTAKPVRPSQSDLEALDYYIEIAADGARDFDPKDPERTSEYAQYPAELAALERIRDYLTEAAR